MLDTSMASALIKNLSQPLRDRLVATPVAQTCMSAVTESELRFGLAKMPQTKHAQAARQFLATVPVMPWNSEAAAAYGSLRAALERVGTALRSLRVVRHQTGSHRSSSLTRRPGAGVLSLSAAFFAAAPR